MAEISVCELAKQLNMTTKRLIETFAEINIHVGNHLCPLDDEEVGDILDHLGINNSGSNSSQVDNKSVDSNDVDTNKDLPAVVKQMSQIDVPKELVEGFDVKGIIERFSILYGSMDETQNSIKELDAAGFLKKCEWAISGKTTKTLVDSQKVFGEFIKLQSVLVLINSIFAKELYKQQHTITNQQKVLEEQNEEIKAQQSELERQNQQIQEAQKTIENLLCSNDEQDKAIQKILKKATHIEDIKDQMKERLNKIRVKSDDEITSWGKKISGIQKTILISLVMGGISLVISVIVLIMFLSL